MKERRNLKRAKKYFSINILSIDSDGKNLSFGKVKSNPKFCDEAGLDFTPEG
ncbi:MAG: hypothetical protein HQ579_08515, partial [Candidatus Omnitrophica bacterium]|nr:hypothetical protein [Candidatus Omnitrophota bacterium]